MLTFQSTQFAFGGFANGVLLGPITAFLGGRLSAVVRNCVLIMAVAYAAQAIIYSEASMAALAAFAPGGVLTAAQRNAPFVCTTMLLSFFQFSLGTTITAETTAVVPSDMKGTLLGIEHSLFAVARIFGHVKKKHPNKLIQNVLENTVWGAPIPFLTRDLSTVSVSSRESSCDTFSLY